MTNNADNKIQEAFLWIVNILKKRHIPFQIACGLAAISYGVKRDLYDIDIDIPEDLFARIILEVSPYIIFGPARFKDTNWDIYLLTLCYKEQLIDIDGAYQTKIMNAKNGLWEPIKTDFSLTEKIKIYGEMVPVISRSELIKYKTILNREVDQLDLLGLLYFPLG